ncbi:bestrophin family protein [Schlesneria paludicola]|uniref:bestrophin family protein n=1 Tax=Schlesneria paludicola TaxID=360056 RepID=UPI00029B47E8|nr:bestrophin family ion channel [Schlesneria paludicola]
MPIPESSFWFDVFPRDPLSHKYVRHVLKSLLPFVGVGIAVYVLDRFTPVTMDIGIAPYEMAGAVLGVFLVLRTNSGYDRWWEARKLWGGITNQCRSMATAAAAYGTDPVWKAEIICWITLFAHATRRHLRGEHELPEAMRLLRGPLAAEVPRSPHPPQMIAMHLARLLREGSESGQLPDAILMQMERDRVSLLDYMGGCERIVKTPIPRAYNTIIRQFLVLFLVTLPFGIIQKVTWMTPFVTAFVGFPLLALDEIGTELQNPFALSQVNHLPLGQICQTIEDNLRELLPPAKQD